MNKKILAKDFDYSKCKKENVLCNLCNSSRYVILAKRAANDLFVQTCLCKGCGLIYINPRMTKENYDNYYKYFYRLDRGFGEQRDGIIRKNFEAARIFGRTLAKKLSACILPGHILDVGSSTGGVLQGIADVIPNIRCVGIEPSVYEASYANERGIKTLNGLFEDIEQKVSGMFSNIICVQSLNHLLNPRQFLFWARDHLVENGHLILAVKNFRHQVRRVGFIEGGVQIDHPYMFTPEVLKSFVESTGFEIIYFDVDEYKSNKALAVQRQEGMHRQHMRLVAKKISRARVNIADKLATERKWRRNYLMLRIQFSQLYIFFLHAFFIFNETTYKRRWFI